MKAGASPSRISFVLAAIWIVFGMHLNVASRLPTAKGQTAKRDIRVQSSDTVSRWPASAKRFALIIGVDEYESAQINRLEGASNDAKTIAEALSQYAGFPRDQVILLAADQPPQRRPTRNNILGRLSNLRAAVPQDGLLLVAFAGHGVQRGGRAYLLPTDAQLTDDITLLEETAINLDVIRNWIRQAGIGQVVLIVDACRNDPTTGRGDSGNPLTEAYTRALSFDVRNHEVSAFVTLYATGVGHVAYEYKEKKQGYFSWALVEGLKGAAANEKGEVTLAGLRKYVEEEVPRRSLLDLGKERQQRPFAITEGYKADELVISVTAPKAVPSAGSNAVATTTFDPGTMKDLNAWNKVKNSNKPEDYYFYLKEYPNGAFAEVAKSRLNGIEASAKVPAVSASKDPIPSAPAPSKTRTKALPEYYNDSQFRLAFSDAQALREKPYILDSTGKIVSRLTPTPLDAISEFRKALKLSNEKCWECLNYIGQIYLEIGRNGEAATAFRQCLALNPENEALVVNMLGVALYHQGDRKSLEEAAAAFRRASELSGEKMTHTYFSLGRTLFRLGKEQEGLTAFRTYLEADPSGSYARQVRTTIDNPRLANEKFAPSFNVKSPTGHEELSSNTYNGKVALLDFWECSKDATVRAPGLSASLKASPQTCREHLRDMKSIWKKYGGDKFVLIGINLDYNQKSFDEVIQQEGINWPQYFENASTLRQLFSVFSSVSSSYTILIDQDGIIREQRTYGSVGGSRVADEFRALSDRIGSLLKRGQDKQTSQ